MREQDEDGRSEFDRVMKELAQKLADEGRLIEAGWAGYRAMKLPPGLPDSHASELRVAFLAGAHHLWSSILTMMDPGGDPSGNDVSRMEKIEREMEDIGGQLARGSAGTAVQ